MAEFKSWPKVANIYDKVVVTEMIDGAGAFAVHIERLKFSNGSLEIRPGDVIDFDHGDMTFMRLTAQSRTRLISPRDDTHGFAKWVAENASGLAATLGEGIHYGEWWGYKINRGYGLAKGDKRFSLYNTERWSHLDGTQVAGLWCVPVLDTGYLFTETNEDTQLLDLYTPIHFAVETLRESGSMAAPGYDRPEGVVVFHTGGRVMFKYVLEDAEPVSATGFTYTYRSRAEQAELTALEDAAKFDMSQAYAEAVSSALENSNDRNIF